MLDLISQQNILPFFVTFQAVRNCGGWHQFKMCHKMKLFFTNG